MPNHSLHNKETLRRKFLKKRLSHEALEIQEKSAVIEKNFLRFLRDLPPVRTVALYAEHKKEVPTQALFKKLRQMKIRIAYPKVNRHTREMDFFEVKNIKHLKPASYSILEPQGREKKISPSDIDVLVVPAIAFDGTGHRLGYGKGYYDHLLRHNTQVQTVGLAFEFQMVKKLPRNAWDQAVKVVITEKKITQCYPKVVIPAKAGTQQGI